MAEIKPPAGIYDLPIAVIKNMTVLAASAFGVVVALAWNQLITYIVTNYLDPYLGKDGSLASLFVYATAITFIAVIVTMQLTGLQRRLEDLQFKIDERRKNRATK